MRGLTKIRTRAVLVACLLTTAIAMPAWGDTLILRNGRTFSGTLRGANTNTITFADRNGQTRRYSAQDVEAIQFGDAPYRSGMGPGGYGRPGDDNLGNRSVNRSYDPASMERVVLPIGTEVAVRTNERIDARDAVQGQAFQAQIEDNVRGSDGSIAIPRGSDATLIIRRLERDGDLTLDVESITVDGRRYRVSTADEELQNNRQGVGANRRTGEYVGGGAMLGAIVGAIAGGGRGAAIGAAAGAGAGAGAQIITRGREVHVPAESVLRFRLDRPLRLHSWS
jgi:hypothetical protein